MLLFAHNRGGVTMRWPSDGPPSTIRSSDNSAERETRGPATVPSRGWGVYGIPSGPSGEMTTRRMMSGSSPAASQVVVLLKNV